MGRSKSSSEIFTTKKTKSDQLVITILSLIGIYYYIIAYLVCLCIQNYYFYLIKYNSSRYICSTLHYYKFIANVTVLCTMIHLLYNYCQSLKFGMTQVIYLFTCYAMVHSAIVMSCDI